MKYLWWNRKLGNIGLGSVCNIVFLNFSIYLQSKNGGSIETESVLIL